MPVTEEMLEKAIEEAVLRAYWAMREQAEEPTEAQRPRYVIEWNEDVKARFVEWLRANGRDEEYIRDQVRFLDKYMRPIRCPADVVAMFAECKRSKDHLNKAFRNLLKFYRKIMGYPKAFIEDLKEAIPTIKTGVDTYVPSEEAIIRTLRALRPCYNKLLELGMPESAADFLNGRGPRRIGGKHYMDKIRQIKAFYPRYLAYLREVKARVEQD